MAKHTREGTVYKELTETLQTHNIAEHVDTIWEFFATPGFFKDVAAALDAEFDAGYSLGEQKGYESGVHYGLREGYEQGVADFY